MTKLSLLNYLMRYRQCGFVFQKMRLMILEQKYLEMLEDGQHHEALDCLRNQVTPLKPNTEHVRQLSS